MESVGTSVPRKLRDLFDERRKECDKIFGEESCQSDAMAGSMLAWLQMDVEDSLKWMQEGRRVRKDKRNDY